MTGGAVGWQPMEEGHVIKAVSEFPIVDALKLITTSAVFPLSIQMYDCERGKSELCQVSFHVRGGNGVGLSHPRAILRLNGFHSSNNEIPGGFVATRAIQERFPLLHFSGRGD